MRLSLRRRIAAATVAAVLCVPTAAHATGVMEFPDNGSEQGGRGGAWIARASDPLAVFYNPAGLAGQPTRLILQSNINFQKTCFTRIKAASDVTTDPDRVAPGGSYPQVCSADGAGLDPQIAFTYHLSDRIGLGFAPILAPSAGASSIQFPEFVQTTSNGQKVYEPSPSRYMLTNASLLVVTPTLGIGAEVIDRLRLGASFEWGIASLSFTNAVAASANTGGATYSPQTGDVKAVADVHDYFFPGFTLGALYSPTDDFDLAAWFKWSAPINAEGDITTTTNYYTPNTAEGKPSNPAVNVVGNTALPNCGDPMVTGNPCGSGDNAKIKITIPMEAKVGFRYHKRRSDIPYDEHVRDPMAQDVFDVEVDLTYANNSSFQTLQVLLPGNATGEGVVPINGIGGTFAPPNASIPQGFKDVYGVRFGGDVNVLRDTLALRGGGFAQSNGQNSQYQNLAFMGSANFGLAAGATWRIHFSKDKSNALEVSAGYEHIFYLNETNTNPDGTAATAGTPCPGGATIQASGLCPGGVQTYRTGYAINLGTITDSVNVLNVGLGYKF